MKIKRILIFILTMFIVFNVSTCYAKDAIPSADASASEITKYVNKNGTSNVPIDNLLRLV